MTQRLFAIAGVAALAPFSVHAESLLLDEIVASAALLPVEINRTGATVEVVEQDELDGAGQSVGQTLSRLPGVSFSSNGGLGANSTLRVRGLGGSYVGVRINGIDVTDPSSTQTAFNFGTLTSGLAGRVEVLKGSQSALYGSSAIAGVVDISTRKPDRMGFSLGSVVEAGSFGTVSGTATLTNKTGKGSVALTLSRVETDGFSTKPDNDEDDGFEQTLLTFSADYQLTESLRLGLSALHADGTVEFDADIGHLDSETESTRTGVRAFAEYRQGVLTHEVAVSAYEIERDQHNVPSFYSLNYKGERTRLEYKGGADLSAATRLAFGAIWMEEKSTVDGVKSDSESRSVFGEVQHAATDALDLSLSLRYDDDDDFDGEFSGRGALAWQIQQDLTLRAVLGTGYRAPSLYERFGPYALDGVTLEPEKSRSAEIGLEKRYETGFAKVTAFYTEVDDLIGFHDPDGFFGPLPGGYRQVPGTTRTQGVEFSGRYALAETVALYGNYTYTDAKDPDGRMARVPRHDLLMGVEAGLSDRLSSTFEVRHVADVKPSAYAPSGHKVGDYTLANAALTYDLTETATAYLRVENLFDEDYQTAGGYNTAERSFFVGLRADF
ncbi:vitamin B12 transporter [Rhodovulum imhoffii]|uniref:Vitamin B12 transporter n=1 Tax=Rhodovulum imhoffii TaxID=365340 RepID=A0A2T5BVG7_9RHOB|nr:TonB-dependent receptor [Rhodovulum imhoffii]MBK5934184.1 hypothetical protein [Rhodovulum imhoffii]PTN03569.1 vitamin B12 transporter [Rhodovulum imhoffii]